MRFFPTAEASETAKFRAKVFGYNTSIIPYRSIWMLLTVCGTPWIASRYHARCAPITQFLCDVCGRRPWAARPFDLWFVDCLTAGSVVLPGDGLLPVVRESLPR